MVRLDLLPKIRGDFLNLTELIFPAIKVAKTPTELVHEKKGLNFKLFLWISQSGMTPGCYEARYLAIERLRPTSAISPVS